MADETMERINRFHAHLDVCSQCRNHPFALCATGADLLKHAAAGALGILKPEIKWFTDSPDVGPECICSSCGLPILEKHGVPIRVFDKEQNMEARFHPTCAHLDKC